MNKTNTPTPEEAGAATSSVTKFQCKDSENQRHEQSSELNSLMALVSNRQVLYRDSMYQGRKRMVRRSGSTTRPQAVVDVAMV